MQRKSILVSLLAVIGVTGCDPVHGVIRRTSVPIMPAPSAVLAIVRAAPGVDSAQYLEFDGRGLRADSGQAISVAYWGRAGAWGFVQFTREPSGVEYTQRMTRLSGVPPQSEVDATLPLMLAIEAQLESVPGLAGFRRSVVQRCYSVRCP
jgi:hypothetical protein